MKSCCNPRETAAEQLHRCTGVSDAAAGKAWRRVGSRFTNEETHIQAAQKTKPWLIVLASGSVSVNRMWWGGKTRWRTVIQCSPNEWFYVNMHVWEKQCMIMFFRKQGGVRGKGCRWWQLLKMMMLVIVENEDMEWIYMSVSLTQTHSVSTSPPKNTQQHQNLRNWQGCL